MISRDALACYLQDGYELWYKTPKQSKSKYIHFDTLEECSNWCKRNYTTIKPISGSWQALHYIACFKVNGTRVYAHAFDNRFLEIN